MSESLSVESAGWVVVIAVRKDAGMYTCTYLVPSGRPGCSSETKEFAT
jgi:hypothetical protein